MDNRDYIIAFDENGQPYIAHAWGNSTAHKYIAKWGEGAKARYFYTKEELEAAMQQGKQKVKDTAEKVKDKASAAAERAKITAGKAAEKAKIAGQGAAERAKGAATVAGNKIKETADDIAWNVSPGYRARARMKDAEAKYNEVKAAQDAADAKAKSAWKELEKSKDSRDSSAHGQATYDKAVRDLRKNNERNYMRELNEREKAGNKYWDAREDYDKTALSKIEGFVKDPVGKIEDAAWSVGYDARQAARNVKDTVTDAVRKASGAEAKDEKDQAHAAMIRNSRDAGRAEIRAAAAQANANKSDKDLNDARAQYRAAEKAVADAQQAVIDAQADAKAKKNTRDSLKKEFDSMGDEFTEKIALALSSDARDRREKVYEMFVDMGIKAADARVAAEKAMRAYDQSIKNSGSAYLNLGLAEVAKRDADYDARKSAIAADREKEWAEMYKRDYGRASEKYADTPLAKVKEAAEQVKDATKKTIDEVKSASNNAKGAASNAANVVKDAASNAATKVKVKAAEAKVSSVENLIAKYKKPTVANLFTFDKGTGQTVKASEMYDRYMGQANQLLTTMKANAARGVMPSKEDIAKVKSLYERAVGR